MARKLTTMPSGKLAFNEYLAWQIDLSPKSQREIAMEIGYKNDNIITMFKKGLTKLPIDKVPAMAQALGLDKVHLMRLALAEYAPQLLEVIEECFGEAVTAREVELLKIIREAAGGREPVLSDDKIAALRAIFEA